MMGRLADKKIPLRCEETPLFRYYFIWGTPVSYLTVGPAPVLEEYRLPERSHKKAHERLPVSLVRSRQLYYFLSFLLMQE